MRAPLVAAPLRVIDAAWNARPRQNTPRQQGNPAAGALATRAPGSTARSFYRHCGRRLFDLAAAGAEMAALSRVPPDAIVGFFSKSSAASLASQPGSPQHAPQAVH